MVQRNASSDDKEPENNFVKPSETEHLFQVVDVDEEIDADPDIVYAKIEVCGGEEEGRTAMIRLSLDDQAKSFFATRMFLKACGCEYHGKFAIDTDEWIGRQFYATIIHVKAGNGKMYANIGEYNYDKPVEQVAPPIETPAARPSAETTTAPINGCECPPSEVTTRKDPINPEIDLCKTCGKPVIQWDE